MVVNDGQNNQIDMLKKIERYFWLAYALFLVLIVVLASACRSVPNPRYNEHIKLANDGYVEVTVCNLLTGKQEIRIVRLDESK